MKAKTPEPSKTHPRLKFFLYAPSGWGKTTSLIRLFPQAVIIDTEGGCDHYLSDIKDAGSALLQSNDVGEITQELTDLLTTKHSFRSVILDPVTIFYQSLQEKWRLVFAEDFERRGKTSPTEDYGFPLWDRIKKEHKRINRLLTDLDLNVAMTAHERPEYGEDMKKIGSTYDGLRGLDYLFDVVVHGFTPKKQPIRMAEVIKDRTGHFEGVFKWSVAGFREKWDAKALEREAIPVSLATPEQVTEVKYLVDLKLCTDSWLAACKTKANAEEWSEFPADKLQKVIDSLKKKLEAKKKGE